MREREIELVKEEILLKEDVSPRYITFKCEKCGNVWGVNVEWNENHTLKESDLICRNCTKEKSIRNK